MDAIRRGARLAKRATGASAFFGTGYFCGWAQGREETSAQLLVCLSAESWAGLTWGLRQLRHSLPEGAEWSRNALAKVESRELRVLAKLDQSCGQRDLGSAFLSRIILRRICSYTAEAGPRSLGVQGLAQGDPESCSGRPELAALLGSYAVTVASTDAGPEQQALLPPLTAALREVLCDGESKPMESSMEVVVDDDGKSQQELGAVAVLHLTQTALIASSWLVESQRRKPESISASVSATPPTEEGEDVATELTAVWKALSQPDAAPAARGEGSSSEVSELLGMLNARLATFQAVPTPPPRLSTTPLQDLPSELGRLLRVALCSKAQRPRRQYQARQKTQQPQHQLKSEDAQPQQTSEQFQAEAADAKNSGVLVKAGKILEYVAWVALLGGAVVAISADGLGFLSFHAVPESLRPSWEAFIQEKATRVEELLEHHDPSPAGSLDLPGNDLEASFSNNVEPMAVHPSNIQAPTFSG